jgi:hypothetical protein
MIVATHLIVSLLLIQFLHLDRNDAFIALLFGVFIDFDHLMGLGKYAKANGFRSVFDFHSLMNPAGHWKSMFHNPVALAFVGPLSVASRFAIPLIFWGVHMAMDFVETNYLGPLSSLEAVFLGLATCALVALRYASYLQSCSSATLTQYFRMEWEGLLETFRFKARPQF